MVLPEPFAALFGWIEQQGLLHPNQRFKGDCYGSLQPLETPYRGTMLLFRAACDMMGSSLAPPGCPRPLAAV